MIKMIDLLNESISGINILIGIIHLDGKGCDGVHFNFLIQYQVNR